MTINHSSDDAPDSFGTIETGVVLRRNGSIHSYGDIAVVDRREVIGWVKSNGAGERIFRQAGHPANDADLPDQGWQPLVLASAEDEPNDNPWADDSIQFPRLICEAEAAGAFTMSVFSAMSASMDLHPDYIEEIINRADDAWERAKGDQ